MSVLTPYMGLTSWVASNDPYSHAQLSANWDAVDLHDHSAGKGKQVPTGGILDGAITAVKLAANAVSSASIIDGTIQIGDLGSSLVDQLQPLGAVIFWWRPSGAQPVPSAWVVPYGQQLLSSQHDFAGGGTITLPDLTNRFILGGSASDVPGAPATGSGTGTPPAIGATGGGQTKDLSHSHTVNSHTHGGTTGTTAPGNTSLASPNTDIASNGVGDVVLVNAATGGLQFGVSGVSHQHQVNAHAHGSPSHSHSVGGDTPGTSNPSPSFTAVDARPAFVGLLPLLKVKIS